jgi:hypothetical protein
MQEAQKNLISNVQLMQMHQGIVVCSFASASIYIA